MGVVHEYDCALRVAQRRRIRELEATTDSLGPIDRFAETEWRWRQLEDAEAMGG